MFYCLLMQTRIRFLSPLHLLLRLCKSLKSFVMCVLNYLCILHRHIDVMRQKSV